ncbi:hypothetical protein GGQ54_000765 [Naumannella cuiyingiana]|uniref:Uncharacterized protein n=1 Tax=Naumannella cuiyingiana TaxID=1347891 RepID=A0A7Z0IK44_9ACTN|nr:hypothetical protein [Naumannella cuiyingiana]NYI70205.1 hypothetical protein [Naumannella cuiyingiana]
MGWANTYNPENRPYVSAGCGNADDPYACSELQCEIALTALTLLIPGGGTVRAGTWAARSGAWGVRATRVATSTTRAANGASRLAEASSSAFRAADNIDDWTVSAKYLPGAGGRWNKWAEGVDIDGSVAGALRSEGASFLPNAGTATDRFVVRTNMGSIVGRRGETFVKVVVSNDGRVITAYPVK